MKKTADIIGLPVISIQEGKEVGVVEGFVIDNNERKISGFIIDDGKMYLGAKVLPFAATAGIGDFGIMIEGSAAIVPVTTGSQYELLLASGISIVGAKVLTRTGDNKGTVVEFVFDETGKVVVCEVDDNGEIEHVPAQKVLSFGKDYVFIDNA